MFTDKQGLRILPTHDSTSIIDCPLSAGNGLDVASNTANLRTKGRFAASTLVLDGNVSFFFRIHFPQRSATCGKESTDVSK
jgi:hypothetical protein